MTPSDHPGAVMLLYDYGPNGGGPVRSGTVGGLPKRAPHLAVTLIATVDDDEVLRLSERACKQRVALRGAARTG